MSDALALAPLQVFAQTAAQMVFLIAAIGVGFLVISAIFRNS